MELEARENMERRRRFLRSSDLTAPHRPQKLQPYGPYLSIS